MGCESVRILLGDGKRHEREAHGGDKRALAVVKAGEPLSPEDKGGRHMQNVERAAGEHGRVLLGKLASLFVELDLIEGGAFE